MPKPVVYIANQRVDLVENDLDKLLTTHSITDAEQLDSRSSSVSTVIKATGSRANRLLFGNLHQITGVERILAGVEARIEYQGVTYLKGQYLPVKTKRQGNQLEYHFMIVGQNSWSQIVAQKLLSEIDWSDYDHYLSAEVILWSQSNVANSVFLYTHPQPSNELQVRPSEFQLALNVRRLFKEIFTKAGYRLDSDFIDSDYFSRFWFHPEFKEKDSEYWAKKEAIAGNETAMNHTTPAGSGIQQIEVPLAFDLDQPEITVSSELVNTGFKDPGSHFDTVAEKYTVSEDGGYRVRFRYDSSGSTRSDVNTIRLFVDGFLQEQVTLSNQDIVDKEGLIDIQFQDLFLKAGQEITLTMVYVHNYSTSTFRTYLADPYAISLSVTALTGLTNYERVDIGKYYLPDANQLDFIRDCAVLFNLQFITDEATKTVMCEPDGNFYSDVQESIDSKIDLSKTIETRKRQNDQRIRDVLFRYVDDEEGERVTNASDLGETEDIELKFFRKSDLVDALLLYKGANVLDGSPRNNLFYYSGSKAVQKHTVYRFNNDYTYQPGPNVIAQVEWLPDIRFSDGTINLNFLDVETDGLASLFYSSLASRIQQGQKLLEAFINWSLIDIASIDSGAGETDNALRKAYHSHDHGRLRLIEIENYDAAKRGSTKSLFAQDFPNSEFAVSPTSHGGLTALADKFTIIANVYVERISSFPNPVDIGYTIDLEQVGEIAEYATILWDHYESLDNVTILTNPNDFRTLSKALGSGDLADDAIRDNPNITAVVTPHSVNHLGLAPLHFYSDGFTHPVWISGYGYFNSINAGQEFELSVFYRSLSSGIYSTSTCYAELEFLDPPINNIGSTFSVPINTDGAYVFTVNLSDQGIYTYTIYLYSDYQGAMQLVDQITAKLYVHE